jgi:hypothetical protein
MFKIDTKQEIETWVRAIKFYENNEFDEALSSFEEIADTSKIHFNCGVRSESTNAPYNATSKP